LSSQNNSTLSAFNKAGDNNYNEDNAAAAAAGGVRTVCVM